MTTIERANAIVQDILANHLPRIKEALERGYVDENQILVMYDHAVRARILREHSLDPTGVKSHDEHEDALSRINSELEAEKAAICPVCFRRVNSELEAEKAAICPGCFRRVTDCGCIKRPEAPLKRGFATLAGGTDPVPMETEINLNGRKTTIKAKNGKFTLTYEEIVRMAVNQRRGPAATAFTGSDAELPHETVTYGHLVPLKDLPGERGGTLWKGKSVECTPGMYITCIGTGNA